MALLRSEVITEIAAALAKAQGMMAAAKKDSSNDHFKQKYADLASCWDAIRAPFAANGLSVVQGVSTQQGGLVTIDTLLQHVSGQWYSSSLTLHAGKSDAHGVGAACTYGRRFSLMAIAGIAPDDSDTPDRDDDGNRAVHGAQQQRRGGQDQNRNGPQGGQMRNEQSRPPQGGPQKGPQARQGAQPGPTAPGPAPQATQMTDAQQLTFAASKRGWTKDQMGKYALNAYGAKDANALSRDQVQHFIAVMNAGTFAFASTELERAQSGGPAADAPPAVDPTGDFANFDKGPSL